MKRRALAIVSVCVVLVATGRAGSVPPSRTWCGRVLDAQTDQPIAGAQIVAFRLSRSTQDPGIRIETQADSSGSYCLIPFTSDYVVYSAAGYHSAIVDDPRALLVRNDPCARRLRDVYLEPLPFP